jgi:hypothetical protein
MAMSLRAYYEYSVTCDARSIALTAVKICSKGILAPIVEHGKSPCFSRRGILNTVSVDEPLLVFAPLNGDVLLE